MPQTTNDMPSGARAKSVKLINARLADLLDLRSFVKLAHWNIKGPSFIALHEMLDDAVGDLDEQIDTLAERGVQLGGLAIGTSRQVGAMSSLDEYPVDTVGQTDHLTALRSRYTPICRSVRAAIDAAGKIPDADTADIFTGISRLLDKQLWFIESHLQGE
jgi:starvation-inducible DNA-binding protein